MLGAIIGAVATIGAGLLSSKSNKKAVKTATAAQEKSDAAQIAYQREADARNLQYLSPWMTRGNQAGETIMAALGLGGAVPQTAPAGALTVPYSGAYPDASAYPGYNSYGFQSAWMNDGFGALRPLNRPFQAAVGQAPAQQPGTTPQQAALSAYEIFKKSTGYQSRLQEGQRGQGAMYSALGTYQSGARDKALARFNQEYASREFGNWMGALGNQQGLGYGASAALGGVATGSADRLSDISARSADFATQAAIARAQNQGALYTGIAGAVGSVAGALSSYKPRVYG